MSVPAPWDDRSIAELAAAVRDGVVAADAPAGAALARIDALDGELHAFAQVRREAAGEAARGGADAGDARGGALAGVPVAVKDSIAVAGLPHAAGRALAGLPPAPRDADATARLRAAGAALVGTTNMSELAAAALSDNRTHGTVRNPRAPDRHAGGSSGGSAAAVAAGEVPLALGTDTGGSVILPAALCGVAGLRPTHGRLSTDGVIGLAPSLDTVGVIARSAEEIALAFGVLAGGPADVRSIAVAQRQRSTGQRGRHLRIAVLGGWFADALDPGVATALDGFAAGLADAGARLRPLQLPGAEAARTAARTIYLREASASFARLVGEGDGARAPAADADSRAAASAAGDLRATLPPGVAERLEAGGAVTRGQHDDALARRDAWRDELRAAFADHDLLLCATTPLTAPPLGAEREATGRALLHCTYPICLAGVPALALPAGSAAGLPVGALLIAPWNEDERLLAAAAALAPHHPTDRGDDDGIR